MLPLPESLMTRLVVLRESSLLSQKTGTGRTTPPTFQEETVSDLLHHIDTHKSMGLDGIHPRALKELAGVLTKPLSIIYQQSWFTGEVPTDWKSANVTPIYKKGRKDDLGNYRPVSLTSVPGKLMEQLILSAIITTHAGQPDDQAQSAWVYERQVLLDKPDLLLQQGNLLIG